MSRVSSSHRCRRRLDGGGGSAEERSGLAASLLQRAAAAAAAVTPSWCPCTAPVPCCDKSCRALYTGRLSWTPHRLARPLPRPSISLSLRSTSLQPSGIPRLREGEAQGGQGQGQGQGHTVDAPVQVVHTTGQGHGRTRIRSAIASSAPKGPASKKAPCGVSRVSGGRIDRTASNQARSCSEVLQLQYMD